MYCIHIHTHKFTLTHTYKLTHDLISSSSGRARRREIQRKVIESKRVFYKLYHFLHGKQNKEDEVIGSMIVLYKHICPRCYNCRVRTECQGNKNHQVVIEKCSMYININSNYLNNLFQLEIQYNFKHIFKLCYVSKSIHFIIIMTFEYFMNEYLKY